MLRLVFVALAAFAPLSALADLVNGDFATGDFTGWSTLVATPALGASAAVVPFGDGYRAVLSAVPTSSQTATAAMQQAFTISEPERLFFQFGGVQFITGLDEKLAGTSHVGIGISRIGGAPWSHLWRSTLYNDPNQSESEATIPFSTVSIELPSAGQYLLYAEVQAANGAGGSASYAQLTFDNARLLSVPEPASMALLATGALAVSAWAWRRRC